MGWTSSTSQLATQWTNPNDVLSVLLIIGADIVQKAIAQTSGGLFTPVCFSFGWVAYSLLSLIGILGDGRLLPNPDYPVKVFNLNSGYVRDNKNWIIGRILRDNAIFMERENPLDGNAIRISIYEARADHKTSAVAGSGRVRYFGVLIMACQLAIAAIPMILYQEWTIFMVTSAGTILAIIAAALPQWQAEKLPNKRKSNKWFALTSGNGSRDIMVVLGNGQCLDLEELSVPEMPRSERLWHSVPYFATAVTENGEQLTHGNGIPRRKCIALRGTPFGFLLTVVVTASLTLFWLAILISVAGLRSHTWYLLLVGGLGIFQNAAVAAVSRDPQKRNLPLTLVDIIMTRKVMDGLMDLEVTYPTSAKRLLQEYFPGSLRPEESWWWDGDRIPYDKTREFEWMRRGRPRSTQPRFVSPVETPSATSRPSSEKQVMAPVGFQQIPEDTIRSAKTLVQESYPPFERSMSPSTLEKQDIYAQEAEWKGNNSSPSPAISASDIGKEADINRRPTIFDKEERFKTPQRASSGSSGSGSINRVQALTWAG
ncbi:MAG: hypothetical protein Q9160_004050 [Pyrenula sp. 1 TL-2023]